MCLSYEWVVEMMSEVSPTSVLGLGEFPEVCRLVGSNSAVIGALVIARCRPAHYYGGFYEPKFCAVGNFRADSRIAVRKVWFSTV